MITSYLLLPATGALFPAHGRTHVQTPSAVRARCSAFHPSCQVSEKQAQRLSIVRRRARVNPFTYTGGRSSPEQNDTACPAVWCSSCLNICLNVSLAQGFLDA